MTQALAHRGPDGEGFEIDDTPGRASVGFGHRRLSVIDLATGSQPLTNEDGSVSVVFNGEIYNFRELRARLVGLGHHFRTKSDTEVLVHGYEAFGPELVERLDGMFAFALWDRNRERLLLARDPVGKKPVYYVHKGERLWFASEPKGLAPFVKLEADLSSLPTYLVLGSVPGERTAFRDVRKLPPGHVAVLDRAGFVTRRYWELPTSRRDARRERLDLDQLSTLVRASVEKRLISDVPLGALLSGGVDSSLVVSTMRELNDEVHTFSVGLADAGFDESPYAQKVARTLGTVHHELHVTPHVAQVFERMVELFDEPFADSSALPTFLVSEFARKHVTVVLTGDGGDELFAGYPRLSLVARLERVPPSVARLAARLARVVGASAEPRTQRARLVRQAERSAMPLPRRLLSMISVFREDEVEELWAGPERSDAPVTFRAIDERTRGSPLDRALALSFHTYLPDDLLTKVDRASMAVGLEARSPLLDKALIEHAFALEDAAKIEGSKTKVALHQLLARGVQLGGRRVAIPSSILERPKQGFGLPLGRWFREELAPLAKEVTLSSEGPLARILKPSALARVYTEHERGARDAGHQLWGLLVLDRWLRKYGGPS